jgi:hypothetical protein
MKTQGLIKQPDSKLFIKALYEQIGDEVFKARQNGASFRLLCALLGTQSFETIYQFWLRGSQKPLQQRRPPLDEVEHLKKTVSPKLGEAMAHVLITPRRWLHFYGYSVTDYSLESGLYPEILRKIKIDFVALTNEKKYETSKIRPKFYETFSTKVSGGKKITLCHIKCPYFPEIKLTGTNATRTRKNACWMFFLLCQIYRLRTYNNLGGHAEGARAALTWQPAIKLEIAAKRQASIDACEEKIFWNRVEAGKRNKVTA